MKHRIALWTGLLIVWATTGPGVIGVAQAEVRERAIEYEHDGLVLEGFYAWDDALEGPRPGVLVIHPWWGLGEDEKQRARQLAEMGYAAFALDMYGSGRLTDDPELARQWATAFYQDRPLARARAAAGLDVLAGQAEVDPDRLAVIGYCFGGTMAVELAYSGADLRGAVSFHGNPQPALPDDPARTRAALLICHGGADPFVPLDQIEAFMTALDGSGANYQVIIYSGAQHSFTHRSADDDGLDGTAYDADADRRSWQHMRLFFDERFGQ